MAYILLKDFLVNSYPKMWFVEINFCEGSYLFISVSVKDPNSPSMESSFHNFCERDAL